MRRRVGLGLVCLGAFFLTLAPLVRFYVAEQLVQAPLNQYRVTHLESPNSTYFDQASLKTKKNVTLLATNTVRGDPRAADRGEGDIAVWDSTTNIYDKANPENPVQIQGFRIAFNRTTSQLVNCCGVNVDGDGGVRMSGYGLLFPIADVQKKDYPFFDMTTKQRVPMEFGAVEEVGGVTAYRFTQHVPLTKTGPVEGKLPGTMLGLQTPEPQQVDRYAEAYNTVWVDPRTGIPVKHRKNIRSTVQTSDGAGKMIVAQADLVTTEADLRKAADLTNGKALQIAMVRIYLPGAAIVLGLLCLLVGGIMGLRGGDGPPPPPRAPRRGDGKFGDVSPPRPAKTPGKDSGKGAGKEKKPGRAPAGRPVPRRRPAPRA